MQAPDPIETIMARLMPPALSQQTQSSIDSMIDGLVAQDEKVVPIQKGNWGLRVAIGGGIAAAIGGLCALLPFSPLGNSDRHLATVPTPSSFTGLVLLGESDAPEEGRTEVRREGDYYKVKITGASNEAIFEGDLPANGDFDAVPASYRRKVEVLCRTLDQALDGSAAQREPRPRGLPAGSDDR